MHLPGAGSEGCRLWLAWGAASDSVAKPACCLSRCARRQSSDPPRPTGAILTHTAQTLYQAQNASTYPASAGLLFVPFGGASRRARGVVSGIAGPICLLLAALIGCYPGAGAAISPQNSPMQIPLKIRDWCHANEVREALRLQFFLRSTTKTRAGLLRKEFRGHESPAL